MYRKYDSKVPGFLHNRPNGIVRHIMKRMYPEYPSSYVQNCGHKLFMVNSETSDTRYQVCLGSDIQLPSCQCVDYRINMLPCKHICAVVNLPDVGWQSLGASFNNYPLLKLDSTVVTYTSSAQSSTIQNNSATKENMPAKRMMPAKTMMLAKEMITTMVLLLTKQKTSKQQHHQKNYKRKIMFNTKD